MQSWTCSPFPSGRQRSPEQWGWCQRSCVRYQQVYAPGLFTFDEKSHITPQVGESRASSLGHTSGISWVEGDAQVPNYFVVWIEKYIFYDKQRFVLSEIAFSGRIFWLLHCRLWNQVKTYISNQILKKQKGGRSRIDTTIQKERCTSWWSTCRSIQGVKTRRKVGAVKYSNDSICAQCISGSCVWSSVK